MQPSSTRSTFMNPKTVWLNETFKSFRLETSFVECPESNIKVARKLTTNKSSDAEDKHLNKVTPKDRDEKKSLTPKEFRKTRKTTGSQRSVKDLIRSFEKKPVEEESTFQDEVFIDKKVEAHGSKLPVEEDLKKKKENNEKKSSGIRYLLKLDKNFLRRSKFESKSFDFETIPDSNQESSLRSVPTFLNETSGSFDWSQAQSLWNEALSRFKSSPASGKYPKKVDFNQKAMSNKKKLRVCIYLH